MKRIHKRNYRLSSIVSDITRARFLLQIQKWLFATNSKAKKSEFRDLFKLQKIINLTIGSRSHVRVVLRLQFEFFGSEFCAEFGYRVRLWTYAATSDFTALAYNSRLQELAHFRVQARNLSKIRGLSGICRAVRTFVCRVTNRIRSFGVKQSKKEIHLQNSRV